MSQAVLSAPAQRKPVKDLGVPISGAAVWNWHRNGCPLLYVPKKNSLRPPKRCPKLDAKREDDGEITLLPEHFDTIKTSIRPPLESFIDNDGVEWQSER